MLSFGMWWELIKEYMQPSGSTAPGKNLGEKMEQWIPIREMTKEMRVRVG